MGVSGKILKSVQAAERLLVRAAEHRALRAKPWGPYEHPSLTFSQKLALGGRMAGRTEEEIAQQMLNQPQTVKVLINGAKKRLPPDFPIPPAQSITPFQLSTRGRNAINGEPLDWERLAQNIRRIGRSGDIPYMPTDVAVRALGTSNPSSLHVTFNHAKGGAPGAGRFGPEVEELVRNLKGLRGGGYRLLGMGGLGTLGAGGALGALYGAPEDEMLA